MVCYHCLCRPTSYLYDSSSSPACLHCAPPVGQEDALQLNPEVSPRSPSRGAGGSLTSYGAIVQPGISHQRYGGRASDGPSSPAVQSRNSFEPTPSYAHQLPSTSADLQYHSSEDFWDNRDTHDQPDRPDAWSSGSPGVTSLVGNLPTASQAGPQSHIPLIILEDGDVIECLIRELMTTLFRRGISLTDLLDGLSRRGLLPLIFRPSAPGPNYVGLGDTMFLFRTQPAGRSLSTQGPPSVSAPISAHSSQAVLPLPSAPRNRASSSPPAPLASLPASPSHTGTGSKMRRMSSTLPAAHTGAQQGNEPYGAVAPSQLLPSWHTNSHPALLLQEEGISVNEWDLHHSVCSVTGKLHLYPCHWGEINGMKCEIYLAATAPSVLQHLQKWHDVTPGGDKTTMRCSWGPCSEGMQKESLRRHVAAHMGQKVQCVSCDKTYTRKSSMKRHDGHNVITSLGPNVRTVNDPRKALASATRI